MNFFDSWNPIGSRMCTWGQSPTPVGALFSESGISIGAINKNIVFINFVHFWDPIWNFYVQLGPLSNPSGSIILSEQLLDRS